MYVVNTKELVTKGLVNSLYYMKDLFYKLLPYLKVYAILYLILFVLILFIALLFISRVWILCIRDLSFI